MTSHLRSLRVLGATALAMLASYGCTLNNQHAQQPKGCPVCPPATVGSAGPSTPAAPSVDEARAFFVQVDADLRRLLVRRDKMAWVNATYITEDTEKLSAIEADAALDYVSKAIAASRRFDSLDLPPDLARMKLLLRLPGSDLVNALASPDDPAKRSELTDLVTQMQGMYGKGKWCPPKLKGKCLEVGDIGKIFKESRDEAELKDAWVGWEAIGAPMREKYTRFVELANQGARDIGYKDLGDGWRAGYDMPPDAFEADVERLWSEVKPLYQDLHCYVRAKLRKKYGEQLIGKHSPIPAHLLGNVWAQEWTDIYSLVEPFPGQGSLDISAGLKKQKYDEKKLVELGEKFFTSLGMDPLPKTFWERSQFKKPKDRDVVCHASAWDPEYNDDLRIKMCIKVNEEDLITIHHELGHDYYFHAYHTLPMLFQQGANDGFHEGIGDTLALSVTPTYLKNIGLLDSVTSNDKAAIDEQLKMALEKVAFLPFGLLIDKWRWDVFSGKIPANYYNAGWWGLRAKYQGVAPPVARTESDFDPGAKFHVPGNTPYMRYFLARIYQFQFHRALCKAAGNTGPLSSCSIYGNKAAGEKLDAMLKLGASRPWPEAMAAIGEDPKADAGALIEYFAPLEAWLKEQNKGETCGWDGDGAEAAPPVSVAPPPATTATASSATQPSAPTAPTASAQASAPAPSGDIACPAGTESQGAAPPKGREQFCVKKDASGAQLKQGPYRSWGPGGKPEFDGAYDNDRKAGHWVVYDGNGNKEEEGDFVDGRRDGVWTTYQNGKKVSEKTYKNGEAQNLG
jgi:peptidyl-dipeptidase A